MAARGFNVNWDADWTVRAQTTERGWEAEFAIPLKTLRYNPGDERTWGVNAMRNIRRKNEQVFLSPVPRGYNLLPRVGRRQIERPEPAGPPRPEVHSRMSPARSTTTRRSAPTPFGRDGDVGLDVKWGVRADLTLDVTVNTDFAQVEADEQQVNLTRFPLFFAEKRPFFLENAQLFQLGQPQAIDLFFSRRIGLLAERRADRHPRRRPLSGKLGGYNVGLLNMQTEAAVDTPDGRDGRPRQQLHGVRLQREVGRSNFGAMFVGPPGRRAIAPRRRLQPRLRTRSRLAGDDERPAVRVSRANRFAGSKGGSDYAGRASYTYAHPSWTAGGGYAQVGDAFNPEVGFLRRRAYRQLEGRLQPQLPAEAVAVDSPHSAARELHRLHRPGEQARKLVRALALLRHPDAAGARFGYLFETQQDRPRRPFTVYQDVTGRRVVIPAGEYAWTRGVFEGHTNLSAPISASLLHRDRQLLRRRLPRLEPDRRACARARGCSRRSAGTATTSRCRAASSGTISCR